MNIVQYLTDVFRQGLHHQPGRFVKRLSTKGKVRERDPARIKRKKRRQAARRSRQVNYARAKA